MSTLFKKSPSNGEKVVTPEEQQEKINEVRKLVGKLPEKLAIYCSDAAITRNLRARNYNVKKATKMLKDTLKWRLEYKPHEIRWEEVSSEAETGKIYRSNYIDKFGRTVLVMRPSCQNSKSIKGQIRYLVYCMENAIINLPEGQEQMVWLIDFHGFSLSNISVKVTKETAHVLQDHYPERLGLAILYNPPKFFEPFYTMVKPFLEPKTYRKVKFVYSDDINARKLMDDLFDTDQLESAFGGKDESGFDINKYAERMREDDKKIPSFWARSDNNTQAVLESAIISSVNSDSESNVSDQEKADKDSTLEELEATLEKMEVNVSDQEKADKYSTLEKLEVNVSDQEKADKDSTLEKLEVNVSDQEKADKDSTLEKLEVNVSDHEKADEDSTLEKLEVNVSEEKADKDYS